MLGPLSDSIEEPAMVDSWMLSAMLDWRVPAIIESLYGLGRSTCRWFKRKYLG